MKRRWPMGVGAFFVFVLAAAAIWGCGTYASEDDTAVNQTALGGSEFEDNDEGLGFGFCERRLRQLERILDLCDEGFFDRFKCFRAEREFKRLLFLCRDREFFGCDKFDDEFDRERCEEFDRDDREFDKDDRDFDKDDDRDFDKDRDKDEDRDKDKDE